MTMGIQATAADLAGFYQDVLDIGTLARMKYQTEVRNGKRKASFTVLRELDVSMETIQRELKQLQGA
jgi:hypothetical protein